MMDYYINPAVLTSVFTLPSAVVDNHLKFSKPEHIKALLYIFRNMTQEISVKAIAEAADLAEYDVKEALLYWADAGILCQKDAIAISADKSNEKAVAKAIKPTRVDAAKRGNEDPKIRYMLREAQIKLGRNLKGNEMETLVWIYDDLGLDVSLILLIIQHAVAHNKANIRFIESVAVDWVNNGIDNITDADSELRKIAMGEQAWGIVSSVFGIERRKPSKKETEYSLKWIDEWKISKEMLNLAYEECVNKKSKFSLSYVAKIIESWHEKGYTKPEDILPQEQKNDKSDMVTFDLGLYQKMLDSEDQ